MIAPDAVKELEGMKLSLQRAIDRKLVMPSTIVRYRRQIEALILAINNLTGDLA